MLPRFPRRLRSGFSPVARGAHRALSRSVLTLAALLSSGCDLDTGPGSAAVPTITVSYAYAPEGPPATVMLATTTQDATIYYTTDTSAPFLPPFSSAVAYTGPIELSPLAVATLTGGTTTSGSATVADISSTTGASAGDPVSGSGIPDGAAVQSVDSPSQITLSEDATATASGVTLTLYNPASYTWEIRAVASAPGLNPSNVESQWIGLMP